MTRPQAGEPSLLAVVLIFWSAFAFALVAMAVMNPEFFEAQDPDSFLRIVQVRDLLAGQGWFDLVQHRMDPPGGALLQWTRMIDAPLAAFVVIGNLIGLGESFALTAWPILLLLALMAAAAALANALAGRAAAVWALVLLLFFIDPLILYFPGDIDHHNAQIAVTLATVALTLRMSSAPLFGMLGGLGAAASLAIGLEMLPYIAVLSATIALIWAWSGDNGRAVAAFGATMAIAPGALYLLTGSPAVSMACDSMSWAFAVPAAIGGFGLAVLALVPTGVANRPLRLLGIAAIGAISLASFLTVTPECIAGPYGLLSPEVKAAFLDTVSEAQPIWVYGAREPVGAVGSLGPLVVALVIAYWQLWSSGKRRLWIVPTVILTLSVALSCYQVRTLPFASALAIPVVAVWLAGLRARGVARAPGRISASLPVALGFVVAIPFTWLLVGWGGEVALAKLSDGRIAARAQPKPDPALAEGLTEAEKNCFDPASAALLAEVPNGLVLAPLFYGSTVLKLSDHLVVAGPYHRNGQAILDAIDAMHGSPDEAKRIVDARGVDYVVLCTVSQESAIAKNKAPTGLLAELLAGQVPGWLQPVPVGTTTALKLWHVVR